MVRPEVDRSLHADIQKKKRPGPCSAKWCVDHHDDPLSPFARQALCELFQDEHAKRPGSSSLLPSRQHATLLASLVRLVLHRNPPGPVSPEPCPWIMDRRRNSIVRLVDFQKPRFCLDYYARGRRSQTDPNQPCYHHSCQIKSTRAGPATAPATPVPAWYSQSKATQAQCSSSRLPCRLHRTQLPHPRPHRYPSRPTTQARSQPWHNLTQNSSRITLPLCSSLITNSLVGAQLHLEMENCHNL